MLSKKCASIPALAYPQSRRSSISGWCVAWVVSLPQKATCKRCQAAPEVTLAGLSQGASSPAWFVRSCEGELRNPPALHPRWHRLPAPPGPRPVVTLLACAPSATQLGHPPLQACSW